MVLIRAMQTLHRLGGKVAGAVRSVRSKVSDVLLRAAPAVTAFAPELSAGIAAAGGIARGVSTVAGLAEGALGGGVSVQSVQDGVRTIADTSRDIQRKAAAVREAYHGTKARVTSEIERLRS